MRVGIAAAGSCGLLLLACGGSRGERPGDALAVRVVAALAGNPDAGPGDLGEADVTCPDIRDPQPGDRATCELDFAAGGRVEVDIEFAEDGSITIVAVVPVG